FIIEYTIDVIIKDFDLVNIEDEKQFFPTYDASPVASNDILEQFPQLNNILSALEGKIEQETMRRMNYEADVLMKEPSVVAKEFLEENDYFADQIISEE